MGRLGKAFKMAKRKPGAEDDDGEGSGSEPEQPPPPKQQPAPPAAAAAAAAPPPPAAAAADSDGDGDDGPSAGPEKRGHMVQRHKRELLAQKKASQRAKGKAEGAKALADLEARHAKEMAELEAREQKKHEGAAAAAAASAAPAAAAAAAATTAVGDRASKYLAGVSLGDSGGEDREGAPKGGKGPTKAQKRRDKLAQREQERDARIAAERAALGPSARAGEAAALRALLAPLGLAVKGIRADGHCMYHALADQLAQHPPAGKAAGGGGAGEEGGAAAAAAPPPPPDFLALRRLAAAHMRARRADFEPFVVAEAAAASERPPRCGAGGDEEEEADDDGNDGGGGGGGGDDDPFEAYVRAVEGTAAWGGHVELTALSAALRRRVRVVAAGMPEVVAGEEFGEEDGAPLTVCYVRHELGLGEHYNSVRPRVDGEEDEEEEEEEEEAEAAPAPAEAAAAAAAADGSGGGDEE
jgi:OTU domain-containing protein 6